MATVDSVSGLALCSKCQSLKSFDDFPRNHGRKHGRNLSHCKACSAKYTKAYKSGHLDSVREYNRVYQPKYEARYRCEHPEIIAPIKAKSARKRRAQVKSTVGVVTLTVDDLAERQGDLCPWCEHLFTPDNPPTLDHVIPLSRGGAHDDVNFQALHRACNSRKWNLLPGESPCR